VEIQHRLSGGGPGQTANKVAEIAPDFARMTIEFPAISIRAVRST
jgi:hypothetical protein